MSADFDNAALPAEVHVVGVLIQAQPPYLPDLCTAVELLPGAEVTHTSEDGRAVAVLESASQRGIVQQLDAIRSLRGVLNVALVYQHAEAEEEMSKEFQP